MRGVSGRADSVDRPSHLNGDYLRAITDSMSEGLLTLDTDGRIMHINGAAERLLGWRRDELAGAAVEGLLVGRQADGETALPADCPEARARNTREIVRLADHVLTRKDGSQLLVSVTAAPVETWDGKVGSVVVLREFQRDECDPVGAAERSHDGGWVRAIRDALASDRFVLYAQPIIDLTTREVAKHELLIRMLAPDGVIIAPGQFLPAAEASGLIVEIDRWVAREAVGLASRGHAVQLNFSAHSLATPDLVDDFRTSLARNGADPSLLVVELTETALVDGEHAAELFVEHIARLGCRLALDDFGSGYGGFRYLKHLPVDYLKIDLEFVRGLTADEKSQHIVKAVVGLARDFRIQTIAEGVEDGDVLQLLSELGVDYAQGYAIGRPQPATEVLRR